MNEYESLKQGRVFEGYAFTFCKAAFLVLIFRSYSLLALSGLSALFYVLAWARGIRDYRCWAKPPWITVFWAAVFFGQLILVVAGRHRLIQILHHAVGSI
jgi:hypothetical protein